MNECVMCGCKLPEEWESMVCERCKVSFRKDVMVVGRGIVIARPNTELSFGAGDKTRDFIVSFHRHKPLNKFQIWMYKVCFGIRARNI